MMLKVMILGPSRNSELSFICCQMLMIIFSNLLNRMLIPEFYFQGVLKQSKEIILKKVKNASEFQVHATVRKIDPNLWVQ